MQIALDVIYIVEINKTKGEIYEKQDTFNKDLLDRYVEAKVVDLDSDSKPVAKASSNIEMTNTT